MKNCFSQIISTLLFSCVLFSFSSCQSDQDKAEKIVEDYLSFLGKDSYHPKETSVHKCKKTIFSNLKAIGIAKKIVAEMGTSRKPFQEAYPKMYQLIERHMDEFGPYETWERDHYDGYTIDHTFILTTIDGTALETKVRLIVSNDFKEIIESYELCDDQIGVGHVLANVSDVYKSMHSHAK